MEKMRQLDSKMKHQIDRLLSSNTNNESSSQEKPSSSRLNISSLLDNFDGGDDEDNSNDGNESDEDESYSNKNRRNNESNTSDKGIYRPPKLHAVPYKVLFIIIICLFVFNT